MKGCTYTSELEKKLKKLILFFMFFYPLANACKFYSPVNKILSIGNSITRYIYLFKTQIRELTASIYLLQFK